MKLSIDVWGCVLRKMKYLDGLTLVDATIEATSATTIPIVKGAARFAPWLLELDPGEALRIVAAKGRLLLLQDMLATYGFTDDDLWNAIHATRENADSEVAAMMTDVLIYRLAGPCRTGEMMQEFLRG